MQGFTEGRINELRSRAVQQRSDRRVASQRRQAHRVRAIVDLSDEDSGEDVSYQIVGDLEADIKQSLISISSPFARALIGKSEGDSFEFQAPNGHAQLRNHRRALRDLIRAIVDDREHQEAVFRGCTFHEGRFSRPAGLRLA